MTEKFFGRSSMTRDAVELSAQAVGEADKSDPFAAARVRAHYRSGVANATCPYRTRDLRVEVDLAEGQQLSNGATSYMKDVVVLDKVP